MRVLVRFGLLVLAILGATTESEAADDAFYAKLEAMQAELDKQLEALYGDED